MKKVLLTILVLFSFILMPNMVDAKAKVTIHFFRGYSCSHCESAIEYIENHKKDIPEGIEIVTYEVWKNGNNELLHQALVEKLGVDEDDKDSVPFLVIGNEYQIGLEGTKADFDEIIEKASKYLDDENYKDIVEETKKEVKKENKGISFTKTVLNPTISPIVNIIVFTTFGVLIIGFIYLIVFSRKK